MIDSVSEHPLGGLLDAQLGSQPYPPESALEETAVAMAAGHAGLDEATALRIVRTASRQVGDLEAAGHHGEARRVARDILEALPVSALEYDPPRRDDGRSVAEVVADIPRGIR